MIEWIWFPYVKEEIFVDNKLSGDLVAYDVGLPYVPTKARYWTATTILL